MDLKLSTVESLQLPESSREFERAICLIKPNAMSKSKAIESIIRNSGLMVLKRRRTHLKPEQVRDFYLRSLDAEINKYYRMYEDLVATSGEAANQKLSDIRAAGTETTVEKSNMEEYVKFMTSGPIEILIVAGRGCVSKLLKLMGPEDPKLARKLHPNSLRAKFGGETVLRNSVYGSTNPEVAEQEIKFFFPVDRKVRNNDDTKYSTTSEYLSQTVNPILLKGLMQLCRQKPDNPLVWLADWLLANNPQADIKSHLIK